jgi:hypothetical protein
MKNSFGANDVGTRFDRRRQSSHPLTSMSPARGESSFGREFTL